MWDRSADIIDKRHKRLSRKGGQGDFVGGVRRDFAELVDKKVEGV
jgi:hypothetical protein